MTTVTWMVERGCKPIQKPADFFWAHRFLLGPQISFGPTQAGGGGVGNGPSLKICQSDAENMATFRYVAQQEKHEPSEGRQGGGSVGGRLTRWKRKQKPSGGRQAKREGRGERRRTRWKRKRESSNGKQADQGGRGERRLTRGNENKSHQKADGLSGEGEEADQMETSQAGLAELIHLLLPDAQAPAFPTLPHKCTASCHWLRSHECTAS
jgi:hypothetical protein